MQTQAYTELQRVRKLWGFSITNPISARKLNQYAKRYTFADSSSLTFHKNAFAISRDSSGLSDCIAKIKTLNDL